MSRGHVTTPQPLQAACPQAPRGQVIHTRMSMAAKADFRDNNPRFTPFAPYIIKARAKSKVCNLQRTKVSLGLLFTTPNISRFHPITMLLIDVRT